MFKKLLVEFIGTFLIVFYQSYSIFTNDRLSYTNVFTTFFLYSTLVYSFKDVSGGFFNPVLTLSLLAVKQHSYLEYIMMIISQIVGIGLQILLSTLLVVKHAESPEMMQNYSYTNVQLFFEAFFLVWIYEALFSSFKAPKYISGVAIGGYYALISLCFTKNFAQYINLGINVFLAL